MTNPLTGGCEKNKYTRKELDSRLHGNDTEMQTYEKVTLYNKIYSLTKYNYMMVKNFPKEYKFTLGGDICSLSWQCLDLVIEANALHNTKKQERILALSTSFDKLKLRVRLAQEIKLISFAQFSHLQENYLVEIGRMIGGFLKWAEGFSREAAG